MSLHESSQWLVTYDISDPKRLTRVFKHLKKQGVPTQYSVFAVSASAAQMGSLMSSIARLIHAGEDDVRAYRLPEKGWRATLGKAILPPDLWLP